MSCATQPTPEQFLAAFNKTDRLAAAPRTLGRVLHLLRHPDSGVHVIAELISRDAGLAAEVLRCANSAYYSRSLRVAAINEAVQVIGFHETVRIVSLVAIRQTTHRNLTSYGLTAEDFWAESLFNGLFLEALSRRCAGLDAAEAYTAGLLRFIGRLAIDQAIEDLGFGLFWDRTIPLPEWERETVGLTQGQVGGRLLRRWEFPLETALAVEAQEMFEPAGSAAGATLGALMQFASMILPAGHPVESIEKVVASSASVLAQGCLAGAEPLSAEAVGHDLRAAYAALVSIRETLYR